MYQLGTKIGRRQANQWRCTNFGRAGHKISGREVSNIRSESKLGEKSRETRHELEGDPESGNAATPSWFSNVRWGPCSMGINENRRTKL